VATKIWIDSNKLVATLIGMGRKRLTDAERRDKPLRVRLTPGERALIDAAAGGNASEWARTLLISAADEAAARLRKKGKRNLQDGRSTV
jgi:hypothetical protein